MKRKAQPVVMPKAVDNTIRLTAKAPRTGHQPHRCGSGQHDSRPRRRRTRQSQKRDWLD